MTIYSQHASRGKTQILATYQGSRGVTSSTVTSVGDPIPAEPIVDALNRISALATVPLSVHDERADRVGYYPRTHLTALTDQPARADLLAGTHGLWYECICLLLHQALADLDDATATAPEPIRVAITAELETEARELNQALAEFSDAIPVPETDNRRCWDFGAPFVAYDGGMDALSGEVRQQLDRLEEDATTKERKQAIADLRILVTAHSLCSGEYTTLELDHLAIFDEPDGSDRYFVTVGAPEPGNDRPGSWDITISRWEPDDPDDEECTRATGRTILSCVLPVPPAAEEIADLLNQLEQQPQLLAEWAMTPTGEVLAGTKFTVTERDED